MPSLDPFLMLDNYRAQLPGGFPDHPHRGMETVSYVLSGEKLHEDFKGHKDNLLAGDVQFMTAGRGIVHAEMPASFDEPVVGFALWINLERAQKYCEPGYQNFKAAEIPVYQDEKMSAKVLSGEVLGVKGPIQAKTPIFFIDMTMQAGAEYEHVIPKGWNSMIVVH